MSDSVMDAWRHKDEWRRDGSGFCVVVTRHAGHEDMELGPHRWCVYAYIYPAHPHFVKFSGPKMWQDAATCMPMHGYPSFLRWHRDDNGAPTSVQVGADYDHLHDAYFTHYASPEEAREVFKDAQELFDWLDERKQEKVAA